MDQLELRSMLLDIKKDINELKTDVKSDMKNLELSIDSKLNDIAQNNLDLKNSLAQCERKLSNFDRKRNVLFFGVEEKENNYFEIEATVVNLIKCAI